MITIYYRCLIVFSAAARVVNGKYFINVKHLTRIALVSFMMILGSFNNFLMMYKDVRLVWAAKTVTTPVFV